MNKLSVDILQQLPSEDPLTVDAIRNLPDRPTIVVLDDDPTGTQTVHDVLLITGWEQEQLRRALEEPIFYILTNSRSLAGEEAYQLIHTICTDLQSLASQMGKHLMVVSRSDSTLRGHFRSETSAIKNAMNQQEALTVFVPAFIEGGRFTIGNTHYVQEGEQLIPASDTAFAKDPSFGFASSNLVDYVVEKEPAVQRSEILGLTLEALRTQSAESLVRDIISKAPAKALVVNAASYADLYKVSMILHQLYAQKFPFVIRSAASLVPALAGIALIPPIKYPRSDEGGGGLMVVGSYVPKTTEQLTYLLEAHKKLATVELDVSLLAPENSWTELQTLSRQIDEHLASGQDCVFFTSRQLVAGKDESDSLGIVNRVSQAVVSVVSALTVAPAFLIAKGGITSSDIATKALQITQAKVMGQLIPGVPVWQPGPDSRFPHTPYVVFPGNVGDETALEMAYQKVRL